MEKKTAVILLVEDNIFLSDMYRTKFSTTGYDVRVAKDGLECLMMLRDGLHPDLILLDVVIPKMDGLEVLKNIKADNDLKSINVILLTNLGQEGDVKKGMEMGALDYWVKAQFTPSELAEKLKKVFKKLSKKNNIMFKK